MKRKSKKPNAEQSKRQTVNDASDSDASVGDIFTDEITEFTEARNKIDSDNDDSGSSEEEAIFRLDDEDDESDEELGEWSKRLKQIKFQTKLEKNKIKPDAPERSWGTKRTDFYGSGVKRKPKDTGDVEEDEWLMEEREVEKLQKQLDEDVEEEDYLIPSLIKGQPNKEELQELTVKRKLTDKGEKERQKKLHPEVAPLREELNKCLEELETLRKKRGWRAESKDTCFRLLAANIAFYLHLIESNEDCRGHPVLKRIVQWKKLAAMYEALPEELLEASDGEGDSLQGENQGPVKVSRSTLSDSEEDNMEEDMDVSRFSEEQIEGRPITYQMAKNKVDKKKSAPNNPRVKHREKFRKAQIRRRGQIRQYKPEITKYQGEASGIRSGIIRSVRFK